jgi:3-phenylpropionate/trans-cinnamate dioxygenase ferredoxin component
VAFEKVAELSALTPDIPLRVDVDGVPVSIVLCDGRVHAIHDTCSHQEYSLADGMVWDCQIECAKHGSMFDLRTGAPSSLPATTPVPVFPVRVEDDVILIDVMAPLNDAPYPDH